MTLDQLRIFIAVAERQHMTYAAEALDLAQSAVSAAIASLEQRYEAKLFDRVGRGIKLNEAGELFLIEARVVLARADAAGLMLADLGGRRRGRLLVQASETIASYWLPRRLVDYRRANPDIDMKVSIGNTAEAVEAVLLRHAEIGFIEGLVEEPSLSVTDLAFDQLVVVVGPDHPWARRDRVMPEELDQSDWVMREPGSGTRSTFERDLKALGVPSSALRVAFELPRNEAVRSAVEAGLGATAISATAAVADLEGGLLFKVAIDLPVRRFSAIHRKDRRLTQAAAALLTLVAQSNGRK